MSYILGPPNNSESPPSRPVKARYGTNFFFEGRNIGLRLCTHVAHVTVSLSLVSTHSETLVHTSPEKKKNSDSAMEEANLPEEMIVLVLTWLPVKSLIRFTCVSKRFHSIILSDPKFAKSQFQAARDRKTLDHTLIYSVNGPRFGSLDLGTPSFGDPSSARKLNLPFGSPAPAVALLGSCNATDDYRVLVVSVDCIDDKDEAAVYSSRAHAWKTLEQEEYKFRKMLPPLCVGDDNGQNHGHLGVSAGGCLSLACCSTDAADCIHVWVMREYDVRDSWTKLFNLKFDPPKEPWDYIHGAVLVVETGMVAGVIVHNNYYRGLVKILHNEGKCSLYKGLLDVQLQDQALRDSWHDLI
ncbi:hypothetical protein ACLB2K_056587 [Fragaria x ananassa]